MAISTYAALKSAVAGWLNVSASDLSSEIDNLISVAEARIFRECRTYAMETALSGTITSGVLALPTGYLELKFAKISSAPKRTLERRPAAWVNVNYPSDGDSGVPIYIAREGGNFIFGPYPDSGYTVTGIYYQQPTSVLTSANTLFTTNPDLYLFAALAESDVILGRDNRVAIWESKYQRTLASVNGVDNAEEASGSNLQIRRG